LSPLKNLLKSGVEIRIEDGVLIVPPLEAETLDDSVKELNDQIKLRLPKVGIVEMIREVDSWMNFSKEFSEKVETNSAQNQAMIYARLFIECLQSFIDGLSSFFRNGLSFTLVGGEQSLFRRKHQKIERFINQFSFKTMVECLLG
jgi:hypothetical protein